MPLTHDDLREFHTFALGRINDDREVCLEELVREWQRARQRDEVNAKIREGLADVDAGRGRPAREVTEEIAKRFGFSP